MNHERLVDEMAVTLCGVAELGNDETCIHALLDAGFRPSAIQRHFDEARELARKIRANEGDLWYRIRIHWQ